MSLLGVTLRLKSMLSVILKNAHHYFQNNKINILIKG